MNHKYIHKQDIISKYILDQLDDKETDLFEEHLLYCEQCRKELEDTETIAGIIKSAASDEVSTSTTFKKPGIIRPFNRNLYRVAAAVLILAGAGFIMYTEYLKKSKQITYSNKEVIMPDDSARVNEVSDSTSQITTKFQKKPSYASKKYLAENYKSSPLFENQLNNPIRSGNIEVLTPLNTASFLISDKIIFSWKTDIVESLNLIVYNNKGTIIFNKPVTSPYTLETQMKCGLYYWQLETLDEAVYVGKFTIKK